MTYQESEQGPRVCVCGGGRDGADGGGGIKRT